MIHKHNRAMYGVIWFIMSLMISAINDLVSKDLMQNFVTTQVTFFRYFFSLIFLIPVILIKGYKSLKTKFWGIHVVRSALLFIAILSWTNSLQAIKLPTATLISFSIPIFTLIFSLVFLKEKFFALHFVCTVFMFLGLSITLYPYYVQMSFQSIFAIFAVICFALLDVLNKKFIHSETNLNMIFYSSLFIVVFSVFNVNNFILPSLYEIILLIILGVNSNLILYFLLKAFELSTLTKLTPYRYLELLFSAFFSFIFLQENIDQYIRYGSIVIIPTSYLLFFLEKKSRYLINK